MLLDHIFIFTEHGAPEAKLLTDLGITEGPSNRHPGQGTANRRFFFENAMLELLWVEDAAEAQSEPARRTGLFDRRSRRAEGASPFGVAFCPAGPSQVQVPFPAWDYRPPYLPPSLVIYVAEGTPVEEPFWFYLGWARTETLGRKIEVPIRHSMGLRKVTGLRLTYPGKEDFSTAAKSAMQTGILSIQPGPEHLLELSFDDEPQHRSADFRPQLPLMLRW